MKQKIKDLIDLWYVKSSAPTSNIAQRAMQSQMANCAEELDNLMSDESKADQDSCQAEELIAE